MAVLALPGCVGAISRDEFEAVIAARGGGVTNAGVAEVLDTLRAHTGDADPLVRQAFFGFGPTYGSFEVQNRMRPDEVDDYVIYGTDLRRNEPVQDPDQEPAVPLSAITAFGRVEAIADRALAEFDATGGYVDYVNVVVADEAIWVRVESPRSSATVAFTIGGEFVELRRS